ncbi:MAG: LysE family translocator [Pseudomonadota bacterium]
MDSLIALALATMVLVTIPGPNVALIVANSLQHGFRYGALTVLSTTAGVALQLVLVLGGLSALLEVAAGALIWIKWLGVAYLIWLGVTAWRAAPFDASPDANQAKVREAMIGGFSLALLNPKTLLFNAAFLPQFMPTTNNPGYVILLGAVFIGVLACGDLLWAAFAHGARSFLQRFAHLQGKISAMFFWGASAGLALARPGR